MYCITIQVVQFGFVLFFHTYNFYLSIRTMLSFLKDEVDCQLCFQLCNKLNSLLYVKIFGVMIIRMHFCSLLVTVGGEIFLFYLIQQFEPSMQCLTTYIGLTFELETGFVFFPIIVMFIPCCMNFIIQMLRTCSWRVCPSISAGPLTFENYQIFGCLFFLLPASIRWHTAYIHVSIWMNMRNQVLLFFILQSEEILQNSLVSRLRRQMQKLIIRLNTEVGLEADKSTETLL